MLPLLCARMLFSCSCSSTKLARFVPSEHVTVISRLLRRFLKRIGLGLGFGFGFGFGC